MRVVFLVLVLTTQTLAATQMKFVAGAVNGVLLEANGKRIAMYGWDEGESAGIDRILLAHGRRDVVWKARSAVDEGAEVVAPSGEKYSLENAAEFWKGFENARFHDYAQQSTKILPAALWVQQWVAEGDVIEWEGEPITVLETPGYTRGSVTYLTTVGDKRIAFTGDLIYGDGQILDLYSFQDAIPEAQIRGYHGYGARLADLVTSLQKVLQHKPDMIVPARGPVIEDPTASITKLIARVRSLYRNYLSTNALHWYFKEDRMQICGDRILGPDSDIELMPFCRHEKTPAWIFENATSRLLISNTGNAFLLDCGYQRVIDAVQELMDQGVITKVDGIFVTHYHDDHTDMVQTAAETFKCPVYATEEYADVLSNPGAWHLPAMTSNAIQNLKVVSDGHQMDWHEFSLTFHFFPGQTYYHGALLVKKPNSDPVFFIGDAFAPSGLDDYCVQNRNLLRDDSGYLLCLRKLASYSEPVWLINQHIPHVFRYSPQELNYLERRYHERISVLTELFPWDDPNYGIDEQWAVMYPHGISIEPKQPVSLEVRLTNHSAEDRTFEVIPHLPNGWKGDLSVRTVVVPARQVGTVELKAVAAGHPGRFLVTADIAGAGMEFKDWIEAQVIVGE